MTNQNPEQIARDQIDAQLCAAGWAVQNKQEFNPHECQGQVVREYQTDCGPADYVLFIDRKAVGVIEAKKEMLGDRSRRTRNRRSLNELRHPAGAASQGAKRKYRSK